MMVLTQSRNSMLNILKSKTIWFAILLAALSVAQGYLGMFKLDPGSEMAIGIAISVAITVLRAMTTVPLSEK